MIKHAELKNFRVVFALDCWGSVLIDARDENHARALFEQVCENKLFKSAQIKKIRLLGIPQNEKK